MSKHTTTDSRKSWNFARFWSKVQVRGPDDCWKWQAGTFKERDGYGQFSYGSQPHYAHRVAWILVHGQIPDNTCVLHRCDNPICVNPYHLFLGTRADNNADMTAKGRTYHPGTPGEVNGMSKLNDDKVRQIREMYDSGTANQYKLADIFGVKQSTIGRIVRRESWKHVS